MSVCMADQTLSIFPVDLVKTRLQNSTARMTGAMLVRRILQAEGPRGLYRGLLANLVGVTPEKAIKLAANDYFRAVLSRVSPSAAGNPDRLSPQLGMAAGAMAGLAQVIATNPMETVKIQMQIATAGSALSPPTTLSVVRSLGLRGLYRGSLATLSRDIPFSMIFFQLFASLKQALAGRIGEFPGVFVAGIAAGAIGAVAVTPMDGKRAGYCACVDGCSGQDAHPGAGPTIKSGKRVQVRMLEHVPRSSIADKYSHRKAHGPFSRARRSEVLSWRRSLASLSQFTSCSAF